MADPFDVTDADTPYQSDQSSGGGGNISPDFWRNLQNFGFAAMAAGAQPGATTLGALGKAGLQASDQARQNAQMRMQQQLYGSEAAKNNLGNQLQLLQMNALRNHFGQPSLQLGPNGQLIQPPMQPNPAQPSSTAPTANVQPQESSGMAGPIWSSTPGSTRLNSSPVQNAYAQNPQTDPFSAPEGVNPARWNQALYLNMMGNPLGKNVGELATAGPIAEQEAMAKGRHPGIIEARQGGIAYAPEAGITATGRLEGESVGGAKYLTPPTITGPGFNIGGEPSQQQNGPAPLPNDVGNAAMQQGVQPVSFGQSEQTPQNQYSGVPKGSVLTDIGPGAKAQVEDLMKYHADGEHGELKAYNAAAGATQNVAMLSNYLDTLNKAGGDNFLRSGAGSEWRTEFAKALNTANSISGGPGDVFQPDQVASAEGAYKMTNLLGMQMISQQFGAAREAGSIIMTGIKSNPSMENTPLGAKMLVNGINEVNNNTMDRYTFKDWWARPDGPHPGDLRGADVAFNKVFPPQSYAQRAISQEQPIKVNTPGGRTNLLPGTLYTAPDGSVRHVPQLSQEQLMQRYNAAEQMSFAPQLQGNR